MTPDLTAAIQRQELLRQQELAYLEHALGIPPPEKHRREHVPATPHPRSPRQLTIALLRQRDGTNCYLCHQPLDTTANIEHIIPIALGGENEPHNVRLACTPCNTRKADQIVSIRLSDRTPCYHPPR